MAEIDIPTEQLKRLQSTETAMAHHQWAFLVMPDGWKIETPNDTYTIRSLVDGRWACSCPDAVRYSQLGLDCKHICGLRIFLEEDVQPRSQKPILKGDIPMDTDFLRNTGWVKLFHPSSAEVTIPLRLDKPILVTEAQALMESVTSLLQAGFSVEAPGLEEGEHVEEIGFVVQRSKANTDGTETPMVDLYPARGNFRLLGKYLNNTDDIRDFESACGLALDILPLYEGDNAIERGKNPKMDKYIVALKHPVKVIWKYNIRYEGEQDKHNPKRLFVRWDSPPSAPLSNKMRLEKVQACTCPLGTKTHPEYKGMTLGQIAQAEDGQKVLEYLAGDRFHPNGDKEGHKVKAAAKLLLDSLQPAKSNGGRHA